MDRMKRLSGLDATFLHLESPETPMHVGALHIFELPKGFKGKFVTALRRHMTERLPLAPPEIQQDVELAKTIIQGYTKRLSRYRCDNCGFKARQFYWRCPGCGGWETYPPKRTEEFDIAP